jgi:hypothetical protein
MRRCAGSIQAAGFAPIWWPDLDIEGYSMPGWQKGFAGDLVDLANVSPK